MAFKEDFSQFIQLGDFAEPVGWDGQQFNGIFDNETYRIEGENAVPVDIQRPVVGMTTCDTEGMKQGDIITRIDASRDYKIVSFAPDGTGMTLIGLADA